MLENVKGAGLGVKFNCFEVRVASSSAIIRPRAVTAKAASLSKRGMVMLGVLSGNMLEVITRPARMLPQASRLIGLRTAAAFSLMGDNELKRGWPIETKKTTRRL